IQINCVHLNFIYVFVFVFLFNVTYTPEIYTLSLHDALPIYIDCQHARRKLNGEPSAAERRSSRSCLPSSGGIPGNQSSRAAIEGRGGQVMSTQEIPLQLVYSSRKHHCAHHG